mmetsp:Transcript_46210/g.119079  ORF Transcript_46210/g.119079 Transcript_46210/m.119079 type:complete len:203 (+) Transcript_46210:1257-1865(+)
MIVRPNQRSTTVPSSFIFHTTEKARRSTSSCREQRFSHSTRGSIGTAFCIKYTVVERRCASLSSAVPRRTKCETSAMCTPTSYRSSPMTLQLSASSRSLAVNGSIVKMRDERRSFRSIFFHFEAISAAPGSSSSGTDQADGLGGRQASTSAAKLALFTLFVLNNASVSASTSPAAPSATLDSSRPTGCHCSLPHPIIRASYR